MSRPVSPAALYGTLGAVSLVVAVAAATTVGLSVAGVIGVVAFGALAGVSWRRSRSLGTVGHPDTRWWKFVLAGLAGLTTCLLAVAGRDQLAAGPWALFAAGLLTSVALIVTGLGMYVVRGRTHAST